MSIHESIAQQTMLQPVQATQASKVTATSVVNAYPAYLPGKGKLFISDPLQRAINWQQNEDQDSVGSCQFKDGAMHVREEKSEHNYGCKSFFSLFANFALEVQMTIIQGDCSFIDVRVNNSNDKLYDFVICQNGLYQFNKYLDGTGKNVFQFASGSHVSIKKGLRQMNLLAVYANKDILRVFVNGQQIAIAQDGDFATGFIELGALDNKNATEVVYKQAKVWTLS
jgi:hypothetical protein